MRPAYLRRRKALDARWLFGGLAAVALMLVSLAMINDALTTGMIAGRHGTVFSLDEDPDGYRSALAGLFVQTAVIASGAVWALFKGFRPDLTEWRLRRHLHGQQSLDRAVRRPLDPPSTGDA